MRRPISDPEVIMRVRSITTDEHRFPTAVIHGDYYRVIPTTFKEIQYLQMLEKYQQIWAPFRGNGVIVSAEAIDCIDPPDPRLK